jgi:hypothetical protein
VEPPLEALPPAPAAPPLAAPLDPAKPEPPPPSALTPPLELAPPPAPALAGAVPPEPPARAPAALGEPPFDPAGLSTGSLQAAAKRPPLKRARLAVIERFLMLMTAVSKWRQPAGTFDHHFSANLQIFRAFEPRFALSALTLRADAKATDLVVKLAFVSNNFGKRLAQLKQ